MVPLFAVAAVAFAGGACLAVAPHVPRAGASQIAVHPLAAAREAAGVLLLALLAAVVAGKATKVRRVKPPKCLEAVTRVGEAVVALPPWLFHSFGAAWADDLAEVVEEVGVHRPVALVRPVRAPFRPPVPRPTVVWELPVFAPLAADWHAPHLLLLTLPVALAVVLAEGGACRVATAVLPLFLPFGGG